VSPNRDTLPNILTSFSCITVFTLQHHAIFLRPSSLTFSHTQRQWGRNFKAFAHLLLLFCLSFLAFMTKATPKRGSLETWVRMLDVISDGWSWASLTPKASSRGEAFPHTYKVTTSPFHNRCGTTPTISPSHIGPWVGAATTRFSRGLLG
jgi:hypothetical protein